jgi:DNA-binding NtrC family response regulator
MKTPTAHTILLIEDNVVVCRMLETILVDHGYTIATAATVQDAEETRQRLGPAGIALVVADVHLSDDMQAQEGIELAARWLALHPKLPVLLISGDPRPFALPRAHAGRLQFLLKPFSLQEFLGTVAMLLQYASIMEGAGLPPLPAQVAREAPWA